jgi:hypothetical protein
MVQAFLGEWGKRYDVVDSHLTAIPPPRSQRTPSAEPPPEPEPA